MRTREGRIKRTQEERIKRTQEGRRKRTQTEKERSRWKKSPFKHEKTCCKTGEDEGGSNDKQGLKGGI